MTFSIVARSADGKQFGIAVASKFLAVGSAVPAAEGGVGALATQAYANLTYRVQGLTMLRTGVAPADVVAGLTAADPERQHRQLGVVGPTGDGATFSGEECLDWAGGLTGDGYAIQGNILTGPEVVEAMRRAWLADPGHQFAERLRAAPGGADRAPHCWWSSPAAATAASPTSRSTCVPTTTPARSPSWYACCGSTAATSPSRTPPPRCR